MATPGNPRVVAFTLAVVVIAGVALAWLSGAFSPPDPLVVYCAHDEEFSAPILRKFTEQTGIPLEVRYDTEATKSLGLVNLLLQERDHPRCDVFWNNQVLTTMELQDEGLLVPYKGPGFDRIPEEYQDPAGHWSGFAARLRVMIVNQDKTKLGSGATLTAKDVFLRGELNYLEGDLSRAAIAKPLYGTTLTHYALLWQVWGADKLKEWHRDTRKRGMQEVNGNGAVKNLVAAGTCDFGYTDTDDYFGAMDAAKPVTMWPVRVSRTSFQIPRVKDMWMIPEPDSTICIPNSVAIIKGTKRLDAAQKLVDFLLSQETEYALAFSPARQIPLGPVVEKALPQEVRDLLPAAKEGYDLRMLGRAHKECLAWLKSEYLQ